MSRESVTHNGKRVWLIILVLAIILAVFMSITLFRVKEQAAIRKAQEAEVELESKLYSVIGLSDLSTYECVYNDICTVMDGDKSDMVAYYCAYESRVKAGIDFDKVDVEVKDKTITVTIPEVRITDINVDIASLDYMFEDKKADTNTVSQQAYKACIADVERKCASEERICQLAEQNAQNILRALILPFVQQLDSEYVLEIRTQGDAAE
ncbi:MAG: DUF4230 domain-containing protein [Butyrivibrio sp.]|nr:DUF4230 domain-containing protein [Muribaculum sp.]MCM1552987.1 DUF4230 domain-containing protein [Butyrivibrio sp.]